MIRRMSREEVPNWVLSQQKTMVMWINSKLADAFITDLTKDLQDGLVLIKLINQISLEASPKDRRDKSYVLTPIYSKPKFKIQKIENLNDFLNFCRLVLKINILNISADNIYEGNLKLILGLGWSIFVYSTANSISISNSSSFSEITTLLLRWINTILNRKNVKITNFNKDWSIEINRPDLYLSTIINFYLPSKFSCCEKKLQNLTNVLNYAESIGIAKLADLDDFTNLVPEEKCIVSYLIEWFKYFEIDQEFTNLKVDDLKLDTLIEIIVETVKLKNKYETKSLRFINKINSIIPKINSNLNFFERSIIDVVSALDYCLNLFDKSFNNSFNDFNRFSDIFNVIQDKLNDFIEILKDYEGYRSIVKPQLSYKDYPELESLFHTVNSNLSLIHPKLIYQPIKSLSLSSISKCFDSLNNLDVKLVKLLKEVIAKIKENSKLKEINNYLDLIEKTLNNHKNELESTIKPLIIKSLNNFDYLIEIGHKLDYYSRRLSITKSTSQLKKLLESAIIASKFDCDIDANLFPFFKKEFSKYQSLTNFEVNKRLRQYLTSNITKNTLDSFIKLIPQRSFDKNDSDFSIQYTSDESDYSNSLFDGIQKKINSQLSVNNKLYDLSYFIGRIENGFKV